MFNFNSVKILSKKVGNLLNYSTSQATCSKLQVYGMAVSQPTRSVLFLCNEAKLDFKFNAVDARKLENRSPEFLKMHPAGLLPVINDDGFVLGESGAILSYLAESNALTDWYPFCIQTKAKINFWMHWHHDNTRKSALQLFFPSVVYPMKTEADQIAMIKKGTKSINKACLFLNNHFATGGSKFLVGSKHPSIADILLLPELDQISKSGCDLFDFTPYPLVEKYMEDVKHSLNSYEANFKPVKEVAEEFKKKNKK
jgi:glutathione S-transferase